MKLFITILAGSALTIALGLTGPSTVFAATTSASMTSAACKCTPAPPKPPPPPTPPPVPPTPPAPPAPPAPPTPPTPPGPPSNRPQEGQINVLKVVINDNGGTKTVSDFTLFVNGYVVVSGVTNTFATTGGVFTVTETADSHYTHTFSGDCDSDGRMNLNPGNYRSCIITNDDIGAAAIIIVIPLPPVPPLSQVAAPLVPPQIHVTKVASVLSLPAGGGPVTYTVRITNPGTVALNNIGLLDDKCDPLMYVSGDANGNDKLDTTETWLYYCQTNLVRTTVNTVIASGEGNGFTVTDFAIATVVVAAPPLLPPPPSAPVPRLPRMGFAPAAAVIPVTFRVYD